MTDQQQVNKVELSNFLAECNWMQDSNSKLKSLCNIYLV